MKLSLRSVCDICYYFVCKRNILNYIKAVTGTIIWDFMPKLHQCYLELVLKHSVGAMCLQYTALLSLTTS